MDADGAITEILVDEYFEKREKKCIINQMGKFIELTLSQIRNSDNYRKITDSNFVERKVI